MQASGLFANSKGLQSRTLASRYALGEEIGRGASGLVFKALNVHTGGMTAIKQVTLRGVSKDQLHLLQREIDLLKLLKNPYIVEYIESFNTKETLYIVMEFVENGSLSQIVKKFGRLNESLVGLYTLQVLEGLNFLHEQGVIHRDIKGANILISTGGKVKLADFGVATKLEAAGLDTQSNSVVGTPYWMAPEIIQMTGFTTASDIWSVGCTVIELISGVPPYFELQPMSALFRIVHDPHPPMPANLSHALGDFLRLCFQKDSVQRPSAKRLKTHHWLTGPREDPPPPNAEPEDLSLGAPDRNIMTSGTELPDHILPQAETIRQVEELVSRGLLEQHAMPLPTERRASDVQTVSYGTALVRAGVKNSAEQRAITLNSTTSSSAPSTPSVPSAPPCPAQMPVSASSPQKTRDSTQIAAATMRSQGCARSPADAPRMERGADEYSSNSSSLQLTEASHTLSESPTSSHNQTLERTQHDEHAHAPAATSAFVSEHRVPRTRQPSLQPPEGDEAEREHERYERFPSRSCGSGGIERRSLLGAAEGHSDDLGATSGARISDGGERLNASQLLSHFAEQASDGSYDRLLTRDIPLSSWHTKLEWRLSSSWLPPSTPHDNGADALEYRDPFEMIDLVSTKHEQSDKAAAQQRDRMRTSIRQLQSASEAKDELQMIHACSQLLEVFGSTTPPNAQDAALFMSEHGMLPLLHMLKITISTKVIHKLLELQNVILERGDSAVCETVCLLGIVPAVLRFVEPHNPESTRLEAARFMHTMCTRSMLTLQMFVACYGLPALVRLLLSPATSHELVRFSIDSIKAVLDMKGKSPRNDLCRTFVEEGVLELLVIALHAINPRHPLHAERAAEILLLFSCADTFVKARMATRRVLPELMKVIASPVGFSQGLVLKILRCIKHLCMGDSSHLDELQRAKAIPHLVSLLALTQRGDLPSEHRNQCVNALYLLCKISRSRQEEAAISGVLPPLQELIQQGSPLKQFALPIVCDIAKASKRARAELKQYRGVHFYLGLLSTEYWQEAALDALLVWLLDEGSYVSKVMETPQGVQALQVVMETKNSSFVNMLDPLLRIVHNSIAVNRALGKVDAALGFSPFVQALVSRLRSCAEGALVRKLLLAILTSLYEHHQSPKRLVERHNLMPVLRDLKDNDPGVLVQQIASQLYYSCEAHDIL
mmetsp:Transcript_71417/g.118681  ORF Transcript_71417/g.118681 Transcript_71417/m.118681 type:complete len:1176 (-) Transcript_71417:366-3893(-)